MRHILLLMLAFSFSLTVYADRVANIEESDNQYLPVTAPASKKSVEKKSVSKNSKEKKAEVVKTVGRPQIGVASWYTDTRTASGVRFDPNKMTAAHKTLPFGTKVKVTNLNTGKSIFVTITDRGPYVPGRIIDLTPAAKRQLGMGGLARVKLERVAKK